MTTQPTSEGISSLSAITYTRTCITLPPDPDVTYTEYFPYRAEDHTYEMVLAGDTGLAYVRQDHQEGPSYTVVHLPSGRFLNYSWSVETEKLARKWIARLLQFADWTWAEPQFHAAQRFELIALLCAGMLVDPLLDDDPDNFDPSTQLQLASSATPQGGVR